MAPCRACHSRNATARKRHRECGCRPKSECRCPDSRRTRLPTRGRRAPPSHLCSTALCGPPANGAMLDALVDMVELDDAFDIYTRGDDVVAVNLARLHEMLDLGNGDFRRCGHDRVKIARGLTVDEVALGIAFVSVNDGEVGEQAA